MTNITVTVRRNGSAQSEDIELLVVLFSAQLSIVLLLFSFSPVCKQESSAQTPIIIIIIIERRSRAAGPVRLMKVEAQTGGPHQFPRRFLVEKLLKCIYGNICNTGIEKQTFLKWLSWPLSCSVKVMKPHNSFF